MCECCKIIGQIQTEVDIAEALRIVTIPQFPNNMHSNVHLVRKTRIQVRLDVAGSEVPGLPPDAVEEECVINAGFGDSWAGSRLSPT